MGKRDIHNRQVSSHESSGVGRLQQFCHHQLPHPVVNYKGCLIPLFEAVTVSKLFRQKDISRVEDLPQYVLWRFFHGYQRILPDPRIDKKVYPLDEEDVAFLTFEVSGSPDNRRRSSNLLIIYQEGIDVFWKPQFVSKNRKFSLSCHRIQGFFKGSNDRNICGLNRNIEGHPQGHSYYYQQISPPGSQKIFQGKNFYDPQRSDRFTSYPHTCLPSFSVICFLQREVAFSSWVTIIKEEPFSLTR